MPENLVNTYLVTEEQLTNIGDAIREKLSEETTYTVDEMPGKITSITGGDSSTSITYIPEQTVTLTSAGEGVPFNTGLLVDVTLDPENPLDTLPVVINGNDYIFTYTETMGSAGYGIQNPPLMIMYNPSDQSWVVATTISGEITISSVVNVEPEHDIPTMDITFVNANMASSIDVPAKKQGYYIAGISVPPQQEVTVKALISREFDEEDGYIYMVALHSEATFRNDNNTGENCTIDMPPDDATRLYIYILLILISLLVQ